MSTGAGARPIIEVMATKRAHCDPRRCRRSLLVVRAAILALLVLPGATLTLGVGAARGFAGPLRNRVQDRSPAPVKPRPAHHHALKVRRYIIGGTTAPAGSLPWLAYVYEDFGNGSVGEHPNDG